MKQPKSLDSAIKSGAFMVFPDDWCVLKNMDPDCVGRALYLACTDSWSDDSQKSIGNGFLCLPQKRITEVSDSEIPDTAIAYATLIKSNSSARKGYIKRNRHLSEALKKMGAEKGTTTVTQISQV